MFWLEMSASCLLGFALGGVYVFMLWEESLAPPESDSDNDAMLS